MGVGGGGAERSIYPIGYCKNVANRQLISVSQISYHLLSSGVFIVVVFGSVIAQINVGVTFAVRRTTSVAIFS